MNDAPEGSRAVFDRHVVLDQLGGWRGMLDATLPTVAFVVANAMGGLRPGIWAALGAAVLVFLLRLVRRQSVQQGISGLFAVAVAVAIAAASGQARDFFALGLVRNAGTGLVLLASVVVRWPLVGVIAEFLAPSHLGAMASHSLPSVRGRLARRRAPLQPTEPTEPGAGEAAAGPDAEPELHWREDRRMLRAYTWLTVLWGGVFVLRAAVQWVLYQRNDVELLGSTSLVLGLPLTGLALLVTLWMVARLHRHRTGPTATRAEDEQERPVA
ncbi:MAG: hypothetical protein JWP46_2147 [Modestobacter sp.]|nr:hypothetical protein [Modestobacter sp.]